MCIDNPYDTAQKFIWEHELSQGFLDQIANFIIQNAKGVELGMNNTEYVDPYTGASRYTPGNRNASSTSTSYSDPFTGILRYHCLGYWLFAGLTNILHIRCICIQLNAYRKASGS